MINETGHVVTRIEEKLKVLSDYYRKLFTSIQPKKESIQTFFNSIEVPRLTQDSRQAMEGQVTIEEPRYTANYETGENPRVIWSTTGILQDI